MAAEASGSNRRRGTYRHGDLRTAATQAAWELADAGAPVTLRAVADNVGVAHRSLYNHFANREALLDSVAERGFLELAKALRPAATAGEYIAAYVRFALGHPALAEIMWSRPHGTMKTRPALRAAAHLSIDEARRFFARPGMSSRETQRAILKVIVLIRGGLAMRAVLDVDGDDGLIAELTAMAET